MTDKTPQITPPKQSTRYLSLIYHLRDNESIVRQQNGGGIHQKD
jgi:hypothetical protein